MSKGLELNLFAGHRAYSATPKLGILNVGAHVFHSYVLRVGLARKLRVRFGQQNSDRGLWLTPINPRSLNNKTAVGLL